MKATILNSTCVLYIPLASKRLGTSNSRSLHFDMDIRCLFLRKHSLRSVDILAESFVRTVSVSNRYVEVEAVKLKHAYYSGADQFLRKKIILTANRNLPTGGWPYGIPKYEKTGVLDDSGKTFNCNMYIIKG